MLNPTKSVLLKTSAGTDVQYVGGEIRILGLNEAIKQSRIVNFSQANYRAEVAQVVTVGGSSYTPVASTPYVVTVNDPSRRDLGLGEQPFIYSYTTPATLTDIGASAALQREYIHLQLVAKINAASSNHVVAASLLTGTGFTITDDAGYYPYAHQGMTNREGASTIKVRGGFATTDKVLTTAAVYALGVGADLANYAPVVDYATGNLISGTVNAPIAADRTYAVAGQKYNVFNITYFSDSSLPTISSEYRGLTLRNVQIWVDNGAGAATTNLAGYKAFRRKMHKGMVELFKNDPSTVVEWFDAPIVFQDPLGAAPTGTANTLGWQLSPYGALNRTNIGTQTIVAPVLDATGLLIDQDDVANDGNHTSANQQAIGAQEFIVGKQEFMVVAEVVMADVLNSHFQVGFRKKAVYAADYNDYTDLASIGTRVSGALGAIATAGILNNAATVNTVSANVLVNAVSVLFVIKVAIDGTVTAFADGVSYPIYSTGTTTLIFDAGDAMIPFYQHVNINSANAGVSISEFVAVPTASLIS